MDFFIQAVIINKSFLFNFNKKFLPSNLSILKQVDLDSFSLNGLTPNSFDPYYWFRPLIKRKKAELYNAVLKPFKRGNGGGFSKKSKFRIKFEFFQKLLYPSRVVIMKEKYPTPFIYQAI